MRDEPLPPSTPPNTLFVRLGQFFEAKGTGSGVMVIPILLALLLIGAVVNRLLP